jgi:predicted RNA binding protein YcfA (HicA-like mRNA interferase family)
MPSKEIKALIKDLEAQGWRVVLARSGHYKAYPPDKGQDMVTMPSTPSDHRSMRNTMRDLRHSGYKEKKER